ncbi:secretoglobin family 1D member-like [Hippopotamus amphibius kiboko]|uniref:secretoglobin family 1D member-like n=1 Tax=Hippopotamus amphibius kiboko TaxID=575201 RepID=UPI00259408AF|nr:secretoglobin family 1D member-like [Hippopotamus amphibius kiboko]
MRLSLTVLLVTLALCCSEGNAVPCLELVKELISFFWIPDSIYRLQLAKFNAPTEISESKMEVKACVNQISVENKLLITKILEKILVDCGLTDLNILVPYVQG